MPILDPFQKIKGKSNSEHLHCVKIVRSEVLLYWLNVYQGQMWRYPGPAIYPELQPMKHGFRSSLCECSMSYITCVPEDKYDLVLSCDATSAIVSLFSKLKTTGSRGLLFVNSAYSIFCKCSLTHLNLNFLSLLHRTFLSHALDNECIILLAGSNSTTISTHKYIFIKIFSDIFSLPPL